MATLAGWAALTAFLMTCAGSLGGSLLLLPSTSAPRQATAPLFGPKLRMAVRSSHFTLQGSLSIPSQRLKREILATLETWYRRFLVLFEGQPATPLRVQLYPHRLFHQLTGAPQWADGLFRPDGTIRLAIPDVARLEPDLERVLIHELAHAFITSLSGGRAPRWFQEGLAQILARTPPPAAHRLAHPAASPTGLDHAGALAFTRFLVNRHGMRSILDLLPQLATGQAVAQVMRALDGTDLESQYRTWLSARENSAARSPGS